MSNDHRRSTARLGVCGLVAAALGLATGHLLAAVTYISASPLLSVGYAVIDRAPSSVKEWAITHFGTSDKPALLATVGLLTLAGSAAAGAMGRRAWRSVVAFTCLATLSAGAALTRPTASFAWVFPSIMTWLVSVGAFLLLRRTALAVRSDAHPGVRRRAFVASVLGSSGLTVITALAGERLSQVSSAVGGVLPRPSRRATPLPVGLEQKVPGLTPLRTANSRFYRVDTALSVPQVERSDWSLVIEGDVRRRVEVSFDDIASMKLIEKNITMTCVSNEVGGEYVGGATWLGVPVRDLLALAGVVHPDDPHAQILSTSHDGFTASTPLKAMLDERDALLAIGMNGRPLPREHGYPARLVVPGLYGMLGSTKWVTTLKVTSWDEKAYWTKRGWSDRATIKPSTRIDRPEPFATLPPGQVVVGGIAWAQGPGVSAVEVQVDDGPWMQATLGPEVNDDYWRQWMFRWVADPSTVGRHIVRARVIDGSGHVQSPRRTPPLPDGSSGIQERVFLIGPHR